MAGQGQQFQYGMRENVYSSRFLCKYNQIYLSVLTHMTQRRKLRSDGACQPMQNIFKSEHYRDLLPPVVYSKISKTPTVNCDRIRELKLEPTPDFAQNLRLMRQAALEFSDVKSTSGAGKYFQSEEEEPRKWKKSEMEMHNYGEDLININFLKEIDQFIME